MPVDLAFVPLLGRGIVGRGHERGRSCKAFFGVEPTVALELWDICNDSVEKVRPKHLLWGLMLLKLNSNQTTLASLATATR